MKSGPDFFHGVIPFLFIRMWNFLIIADPINVEILFPFCGHKQAAVILTAEIWGSC